MFIPDGGIDVLALEMIKQFPTDAADQAALRSNAFFVLGHAEKSKKWMLVHAEIEKIQAGGISNRYPLVESKKSNVELVPITRPPLASPGEVGDVSVAVSRIP